MICIREPIRTITCSKRRKCRLHPGTARIPFPSSTRLTRSARVVCCLGFYCLPPRRRSDRKASSSREQAGRDRGLADRRRPPRTSVSRTRASGRRRKRSCAPRERCGVLTVANCFWSWNCCCSSFVLTVVHRPCRCGVGGAYSGKVGECGRGNGVATAVESLKYDMARDDNNRPCMRFVGAPPSELAGLHSGQNGIPPPASFFEGFAPVPVDFRSPRRMARLSCDSRTFVYLSWSCSCRVCHVFQERNRFARAGEADRKEGPKLVKHLLAGKMGLGTRRSR